MSASQTVIRNEFKLLRNLFGFSEKLNKVTFSDCHVYSAVKYVLSLCLNPQRLTPNH